MKAKILPLLFLSAAAILLGYSAYCLCVVYFVPFEASPAEIKSEMPVDFLKAEALGAGIAKEMILNRVGPISAFGVLSLFIWSRFKRS